jgi:integrase
MRQKGVPKIESLAATKRSPQRFRVRWDRGSKSFTDADRTEVMRFALDLVANDYRDPRDLGNTYGERARNAKRSAGTVRNQHSFREISRRYLDRLEATPGYLRRYRRSLEIHVYPVLGTKDINEIKVEHIEAVALRCGLGGSSRKRLIGGLLSPIFDYAIDREWRERANPCRAVSKLISTKPTMQPTLEEKDAPMFLDHCYAVSDLLGDFASILYGTGLRWQEASALTVGSVDLKRRAIRIKQVEREGRTRGVVIATDRGKSDTGFRDIPLPKSNTDPLITMLTDRLDGRRGDNWLFTANAGGRIYYELVENGLRRARSSALKDDRYRTHITPHALRRGFAQAIQDRGASADQIKRLLGHKRFTGATGRYAYDRLTEQQITDLQPYVARLATRRNLKGVKTQP